MTALMSMLWGCCVGRRKERGSTNDLTAKAGTATQFPACEGEGVKFNPHQMTDVPITIVRSHSYNCPYSLKVSEINIYILGKWTIQSQGPKE